MFPIIAGYFETYIKYSASFAGLLICMSSSAILVVIFKSHFVHYVSLVGGVGSSVGTGVETDKSRPVSRLGIAIIIFSTCAFLIGIICLVSVLWMK